VALNTINQPIYVTAVTTGHRATVSLLSFIQQSKSHCIVAIKL